MLCALIVLLALLAFVTWGWASERKIVLLEREMNAELTRGLGIEKDAYRQLVAVFNTRTVGASLKHPTVRFEKEHVREQARNPTTRIILLEAPERKRTPRH